MQTGTQQVFALQICEFRAYFGSSLRTYPISRNDHFRLKMQSPSVARPRHLQPAMG